MNSYQYEELARLFIAEKFQLDIGLVRSARVEGASSPGLKPVVHQIDLQWEVLEEVAAYLHIANAKWRASEKIDQGDVLLLEQVRNELNAHKAFLITNTGFTEGAKSVAQQKGIALHILRPDFETAVLPNSDRRQIQDTFLQLKTGRTNPLYSYQVEHRDGVELMRESATAAVFRPSPAASGPGTHRGYETHVQAPPTNRAIGPGASAGRSGAESRGGPPPQGSHRRWSR